MAGLVALSAVPFCSSQKSTVLSSLMRWSSSSTLSVGATQLPSEGICGSAAEELPGWVRPLRNSKPGTHLPKSPNAAVWFASLMRPPVR